MHSNLMRAPRAWNGADQAEPIAGRRQSLEPAFNKKFRPRGCACGVNHLLQPNRRMLMLTLAMQRGVNDFGFPFRPAPNDRKILFAYLVSLHQASEVACARGSFCNQHEPAGLAVESVHDRNLSAT